MFHFRNTVARFSSYLVNCGDWKFASPLPSQIGSALSHHFANRSILSNPIYPRPRPVQPAPD